MYTYEIAKAKLIDVLNQHADAHERGEYSSLALGFDHLAEAIPRNQPPRFNKLLVALSFWDGWIRARNNSWSEVHEIQKDEWPELARSISVFLKDDKDILIGRVARFGLKPWRETKRSLLEIAREHPEIIDLLPPEL